MSAIDLLARQPVAQAIGWALLHFVWQGALVGAAHRHRAGGAAPQRGDIRYVVATHRPGADG